MSTFASKNSIRCVTVNCKTTKSGLVPCKYSIVLLTIASLLIPQRDILFSLQRQMKMVPYRQPMRNYYSEVNNDHYQMENLFKNVFIFEQFCYLNNLKHIILFADCDVELSHGHWSSLCKSKIWNIWKDILGYRHRGGHPNKEEHRRIANFLLEVL